MIQQVQTVKEKIDKLGYIKIERFCSSKALLRELKGKHRAGEAICKIHDQKRGS